jgi:hypothetical protein
MCRISPHVFSRQLTSGLALVTEKLANRTMMNGALNVCRLSRRASPSHLATGLTRRCFANWPKVYPIRVRVITMVSMSDYTTVAEHGLRVCMHVCRGGQRCHM